MERVLGGTAKLSDVPEDHREHLPSSLEYVEMVRSSMEHPKQFLELRVNYAHVAPEGFGTCDIILHDSEHLHIIDLKYGMGVRVVAEKNNQLMFYAAGVLNSLNIHPKNITLHIMQPRMNNFSKWSISIEQLRKFERGVKKIVEKIESGDVKFKPSEGTCRFCPAKPICREYEDYVSAEVLKAFDCDMDGNTLTTSELSEILKKKDELIYWLTDVENYTILRMQKGEKFPGLSLGETKGRRKWKDDALIELKKLLGDRGFKEAPIGITVARKLLSKKQMDELTIIGKTSPKIIVEED